MSEINENGIRFRVFGTCSLADEAGRPLSRVLEQPSLAALLLYLAVESRGWVRREALLELFWPELDEARARRALSQLLHRLRKSLPENVIVVRGAEYVGLEPGRVWCDLKALQEASEADAPREVIALYAGEVDPGIHVSGAKGFEQWLEQKRRAAKRAVADAHRQLAAAASTDAERVRHLRSGRELLPADEDLFRELIDALDAEHRPVEIWQEFVSYRSLLSREYDLPVPAELAARVLKTQERSAERVRTEAEPVQPILAGRGAAAPAEPMPRVEQPRWKERVLLGALLLVAVFLAVRFAARLTRADAALAGEAGRPIVIVERITSLSGDVRAAEEIWRRLRHELNARGIRLVNSTDVPLRSSNKPLYVNGTLVESDGAPELLVELSAGAKPSLVRTIRVSARGAASSEKLAELTRAAADSLWLAIRLEASERVLLSSRANPVAVQLYREADRRLQSAEFLIRSNGRAQALSLLDQGDSLAMAARRVDAGWDEPWILRAEILARRSWLHLFGGAPDSAQSGLTRALQVIDSAIARLDTPARREQRATFYHLLWLTNARQADRYAELAITDLQTATRADPGHAKPWALLSALQHARGELVEARSSALQASRASDYSYYRSDVLNQLFRASLDLGMDKEAAKWCDRIQNELQDSWPRYACLQSLRAWTNQRGLNDPGVPSIGDPPETWQRMLPRLLLLAAAARTTGTRIDPEVAPLVRQHGADPEIRLIEAGIHAKAGDEARAITLLRQYVGSGTGPRRSALYSRMFWPLRRTGESAGDFAKRVLGPLPPID